MDRCPACPNKYRCLPADGPEDADYLFIGEAPGREEERKGTVFCGKTGREVNEHYLPLAGLRRDRVRFRNAISCLPDTPDHRLSLDRPKHRELLESCASTFLYPELERGRWKAIVPMGAFACAAVDPTLDLEIMHGIPQLTAWGQVFPMYHPAGGIHSPKSMLYIRTDWVRLRKWIQGKLFVPNDKYAGREDYQVIESEEQIDDEMGQCNDYTMANDTETKKGGDPFCLTYSLWPGMGRLILAKEKALIKRFAHHVSKWRGKILYHNWLFDSTPTDKMGITYNPKRIVDTMVKVFHLGNLPQGLKALAYRELGMKMEDFEDVVKPYSLALAKEYFEQMALHDWPKPEVQLLRGDDMRWKTYKPHSISTLLKITKTALGKNPDLDLISRWDNWEDRHEEIQTRCGPFPGTCISHAWDANPQRVARYAMRDTDSDLRLYEVIKGIERVVRKRPQEHWSDWRLTA